MASNTIDNFWFCPGTVPNRGMRAVRVSVRQASGIRSDVWVVSDDQLVMSYSNGKNNDTVNSAHGDCYDRHGNGQNCYLPATPGVPSRAFNYTGGTVLMQSLSMDHSVNANTLAPALALNFTKGWASPSALPRLGPGEYQPDCVGAGFKP
jgi:hypothetical protein